MSDQQPKVWLYTLPNCERCAIGRSVLIEQNVEFREIRVEDPLTGEAVIRKFGPQVPAPILYRDGAYHVLGQHGQEWKFVKLLFRKAV